MATGWLLALLIILLVSPLSFAQQPPRISAILIEGLQNISEQTIRTVLTLLVNDPYNPARVQQDLDRVLSLGLFDTELSIAEAVPDGDAVKVVFHLVENPKIESIEFTGNTVVSGDTLREAIAPAMAVGQIYNSTVAAVVGDLIQRAYLDAGYYAIVAQAPTLEDGRVTLPVVEHYVEEVRIEGNSKTKDGTIRRELRTRSGQLFNLGIIQRDLERLRNLDIFEQISFNPQTGARLGAIIVVFDVREQRSGSFSLGMGLSSREGFIGFAEIAEKNFQGKARRIGVRGEFGGIRTFDFVFHEPYLGGDHTSLQFNLYDRIVRRDRFAFSGLSSPVQRFSNESQRGYSLNLLRPLNEDRTRFVDTIYRNERIVNQDPRLINIISPFLREGRVGSLTLRFTNNTTDYIFNPTRGGKESVGVEQAGGLFGGSSRFTRGELDLRRYTAMGDRGVVAFRAAFGNIRGNVPIFETLVAGGADTLRGYREDRFFGTNRLLVNLEYRHFLTSKEDRSGLQGVLFVDVGDAWGGQWRSQDGTIFRAEHRDFTPNLGYGVGVRVSTPLGPIRLDYGIGSEGAQTHFGISQTF